MVEIKINQLLQYSEILNVLLPKPQAELSLTAVTKETKNCQKT